MPGQHKDKYLWQVWCTKAEREELSRLCREQRPETLRTSTYLILLLRQQRDRHREARREPKGTTENRVDAFAEGYAAGHLAGQLVIAFAQGREDQLPWATIAAWMADHELARSHVLEEMANSPHAERFMALWQAASAAVRDAQQSRSAGARTAGGSR